MIVILLTLLRFKANKAARKELKPYFDKREIKVIIRKYYERYLQQRIFLPPLPTLGGNLMISLAALSESFYRELIERNKTEEFATQLFYYIAWDVYKQMGNISWKLASLGNNKNNNRLRKATELFRIFPFNSPSYEWRDIKSEKEVIAFDCTRCPVADYFQRKELSKFCTDTWCALDYPLAKLWKGQLVRSGCIASGADKCDFRWTAN